MHINGVFYKRKNVHKGHWCKSWWVLTCGDTATRHVHSQTEHGDGLLECYKKRPLYKVDKDKEVSDPQRLMMDTSLTATKIRLAGKPWLSHLEIRDKYEHK